MCIRDSYKTPLPHFIAFCRRHVLKVRYISLVNLIADSEVVKELVADTFSVDNIRTELSRLLPDGDYRQRMTDGYEQVRRIIGDDSPSVSTAHIIWDLIGD